MTNRLRIGLEAYVVILERQVLDFTDQKERLSAAWARTRSVYEGEGADAFERAYLSSMTILTHYSDAVSAILPILKERIATLNHFDSSNDVER